MPARKMFRYVFAATDAREIVTRVPAPNKGAAFAARYFHFVERFSREAAWAEGGSLHPVSYQELSIDRWASTSPDALAEREWLRTRIEAAKAAFASSLPDHPHDEAHDRCVGAAVMMMRETNVAKAVWFYNRWAKLAGYESIALLSAHPPILDVGVVVIIEITNGCMEVLQCP
ncbi:MAG: hypothetical protein ACREEX_09865 [Caulobacteraceae bacterium]